MNPDTPQSDQNDATSADPLPDGFVSYGDIAERLGPFDPPADFDHGEEFAPEPPRSVPKRLWQGSYAARRRGNVRTLVVLGAGWLVFSPMPFVATLSDYILPLAYLHWLGLALIACGVIGFFCNLLPNGHFAYVTQGTPIVGRVLTPARQAAGTAELPAISLAAGIEFQHPNSGQQTYVTCATTDSWNESSIDRYSQAIEAGDYVTLVALPDSFDSSLRLYGYLGLDPAREYILKDGRPLKGASASAAVLIAAGILAGIGLLLAAIHVLLTSIPSDGEPWKFLAAAAGGLVGSLMLWAIVRFRGRATQEESVTASGPTLGPIVCGILGVMAGLTGLCLANSQFDRSTGLYDAVEVVNFWETTHNFIIRTYEIEYRTPGAGDTDRYHATVHDIRRLGEAEVGFATDLAVMDLADGALGLPWTRGIYPIVWVEVGSIPVESRLSTTLQFPAAGELVETEIMPVIMIDNDTFEAPDADLAQQALDSFRSAIPAGFQFAPDATEK